MYGDPALPPGYVALPYANPDAPKGGRVTSGNVGGFDSLNPFATKGTPPWQLRYLAYESLLGRSWDEPFTLYGLLAETLETDDSREWVEFTLNPAAAFSDGSPVTVEDVIWSFETLGTRGHLRYRDFWSRIDSIAQTGPGKHFLGADHTQANFLTAFFRPDTPDNNSYEQWTADGSLDAAQRANLLWKDTLDRYVDPGLDPAIDEEICAYIARRKAEKPDANYY
jgi:ABC-type transport system substrate-binding protein